MITYRVFVKSRQQMPSDFQSPHYFSYLWLTEGGIQTKLQRLEWILKLRNILFLHLGCKVLEYFSIDFYTIDYTESPCSSKVELPQQQVLPGKACHE